MGFGWLLAASMGPCGCSRASPGGQCHQLKHSIFEHPSILRQIRRDWILPALETDSELYPKYRKITDMRWFYSSKTVGFRAGRIQPLRFLLYENDDPNLLPLS